MKFCSQTYAITPGIESPKRRCSNPLRKNAESNWKKKKTRQKPICFFFHAFHQKTTAAAAAAAAIRNRTDAEEGQSMRCYHQESIELSIRRVYLFNILMFVGIQITPSEIPGLFAMPRGDDDACLPSKLTPHAVKLRHFLRFSNHASAFFFISAEDSIGKRGRIFSTDWLGFAVGSLPCRLFFFSYTQS